MKHSCNSILYPLNFILSVTVLTTVPIIAEQPLTNSAEQSEFDTVIYEYTRTFAEVLQLAGSKHYRIKDPQKAMTNAIDSFVNSLDPHSNFLDEKTFKNIMETTSGEFFGIGVVIDNTRNSKDKTLTIIDTIPEGPSDTAGVHAHDKIIEIDGKLLEGMSTDEAAALLKGERNSVVRIKVLRENHNEPLSFEITRDSIKEQNSLCFYLKDHNIYYLSLNMFTQNAIYQIQQLLKQATQQKYKALILDLRYNSGGLLNAAVDIAGLFIPKGSLVVATKDKNNKETDRFPTTTAPIANNTLPVFILINNYTASAAEILAGCLQTYSDKLFSNQKNKPSSMPMVFLIGTKTFGKGSVQEVIPVGNNCALKLTTALYYLPNDVSVQSLGIEPDFIIERQLPPTEHMKWFDEFFGREKALKNHIKPYGVKDDDEEKTTKKDDDTKKTWTERAKKALRSDNQFKETITLINILDTILQCYPKEVTSRSSALALMKKKYATDNDLVLEDVTI